VSVSAKRRPAWTGNQIVGLIFLLALAGAIVFGVGAVLRGCAAMDPDSDANRQLHTSRVRVAAKENAGLKTILKSLNMAANGDVFRAISIDPDLGLCTITVDGDIWEASSEQDRNTLDQRLQNAWENVYRTHHPASSDGDNSPTMLKIVDLSGAKVGGNAW
jgi:hypothetical protein